MRCSLHVLPILVLALVPAGCDGGGGGDPAAPLLTILEPAPDAIVNEPDPRVVLAWQGADVDPASFTALLDGTPVDLASGWTAINARCSARRAGPPGGLRNCGELRGTGH